MATFGQQAEDLYRIFDSALEHSDLLKARRALREMIELAARNLEEEPGALGAVHVLADTLDDVGTIECLKSIGLEESPFDMAEAEMLDLVRGLPQNLVMTAPRKVQAIVYVAKREFDRAVATGLDGAFALAIALRAQMGPRPRQLEHIMRAMARAEDQAIAHAISLVNADARSTDVENWERNITEWFGGADDPVTVAAICRKMGAGPARLAAVFRRAHDRLLELRNIIGRMALTPEPTRSSLEKAIESGGEVAAGIADDVAVAELSGKRGALVGRTFAEAVMDCFRVVCGPEGSQVTVAQPATHHLVLGRRSAPGGELELLRLAQDLYAMRSTL